MIEHLTLILPQREQVFTFPVGLALGALLGSILVEYYGYKRKVKENKFKVYSRLKGKKRLWTQLLFGVASYAINIEKNYALINKLNEMSQSIARKEIKQLETDNTISRRIYDERVIDLAKARERVWNDIGLAEILFNNPLLEGYINTIENSEKAILDFTSNIGNDQVEFNISHDPQSGFRIDCPWKTQKESELKALDTRLEHAVDGLLNEIKSMI